MRYLGWGRTSKKVRVLVPFALLVGVVLLLTGSGSAQGTFDHGIGFGKGCVSVSQVGGPYSCRFTIDNQSEGQNPFKNTLTISSISDKVACSQPIAHPCGPAERLDVRVGSLASPGLNTNTFTTGAAVGSVPPSCDGTKCILPFGSLIRTAFSSQYTVVIGDAPLLTDQGTLSWNNLCDMPGGTPNDGCPTGTNTSQANGSTRIVEWPPGITSTSTPPETNSPQPRSPRSR